MEKLFSIEMQLMMLQIPKTGNQQNYKKKTIIRKKCKRNCKDMKMSNTGR